jgi:hypothetical protein
MLACRKHWYDLPGQLRVAILTSYRGCDRKGYVANVRAVGRGATIGQPLSTGDCSRQ